MSYKRHRGIITERVLKLVYGAYVNGTTIGQLARTYDVDATKLGKAIAAWRKVKKLPDKPTFTSFNKAARKVLGNCSWKTKLGRAHFNMSTWSGQYERI